MKNKNTMLEWILAGIILVLPFLYLFSVYSLLPSRVTTHFNLHGQADDYKEKSFLWVIMSLMTLIAIVLYMTMRYLPWIDPKKKVALSARNFRKTGLAVIVLVAVLNGLIVYAAQPGTRPINKLLYFVLGVFFIYMGNLMNSLKPNYFVGIRLPWTLESEDNWRATHRMGGRCFVAGGILVILSVLLLPMDAAGYVLMGVTGLVVLAPCCYSIIHFRRKGKGLL